METVYIKKCESYESESVKKTIYECLDGIAELREAARPGSRVLVKPNLIMRKLPEEAATTHPAVIEAIVEYLHELGCKVIIGDSPGGPFIKKALEMVYKATGMETVAARTGCELNYDTSSVDIFSDKLKRLKNLKLIKVADDVDFVISAAKMKTHGMMTYTGAVKNLFGTIPGLLKADYHLKMNDVGNFAEHLIDICQYINPLVSVIDAVEGMEGNGPTSGVKRHVGLIMASANPHALDVAAASIMGMEIMKVPTIKSAKERGLVSGQIKDINIVGLQIEDIKVPKFKLPDSAININFLGGRAPKFFEDYVLNRMRPIPVFDHEKCISCGICQRSCPPKIIKMEKGKPVPEIKKCIRCFCCHELCPEEAVQIKKHWLYEKLIKL